MPVMADVSSSPEPEVPPVMTVGSLTAFTVTVISLAVVPSRSSVMVTVKASSPKKFSLGVYDHSPEAASMEALPLVGPLPSVMEKMVPSANPSGSVATSVPVIVPASSSPLPLVPSVTIAGSTSAASGVTVMVICRGVVPFRSSVIVTVKESSPKKLALGL